MAVSWNGLVTNDVVWSINAPMYLTYSKDADNSRVIVSIDIQQGSYSKVLTLKYSGVIKDVKINITELVRNYWQYLPITEDFLLTLEGEQTYANSQTMNITVTITDDDNAITTNQRLIANSKNNFGLYPLGNMGYPASFIAGEKNITVNSLYVYTDFNNTKYLNIPSYIWFYEPNISGSYQRTNRLDVSYVNEAGTIIKEYSHTLKQIAQEI